MRLNPLHLSQMTSDQMRLLQCMEILCKNHEYIPIDLLSAVYKKPVYNELKQLMNWKLISYENNAKTCGYRLGYGGYDYMALFTLEKRGLLGIGKQLGVGKESDVYLGSMDTEEGPRDVVIKIHRLGRTSFRTVKNNRDYMGNRNNASWLLLSRLSAEKEFSFMSILHKRLPVPEPIWHNRHMVVMSPINGYPITQIRQFLDSQHVFDQMKSIVIQLAEFGLIHGDLNVYNLMIDDDEKVYLIDFPQMVSTSHENAEMYYDRDVEGVIGFAQKWNCNVGEFPTLDEIEINEALDVLVKASGYIKPKKVKEKKENTSSKQVVIEIRTDEHVEYKDKHKPLKLRKSNVNKNKDSIKKSDYGSYRSFI
eukprot:NODE_29_length_37665_cov_1.081563.p10 type:complete len:365 gc:universal NODE_29_length_37665_cov_1.081563:36257-35163(-)